MSAQSTSGAPLRVAVTLDVEEEGLFSGRYRRRHPGVENVAELLRLAPVTDEFGFPPTLLCSHSVFSSAAACRVLEEMRDRHGAEIGAHLHHWSTPPFESDEEYCDGIPPRTHAMDRGLLEERLVSLLEAGRSFQGAPLTSFRMGRWDLKAPLLPMLQAHGILCDSSVCPLRTHEGGPDHFLAPSRPYWPLGRNVPFLEVPVTQIPLLKSLPRLWQGLTGSSPRRDAFHFLAALSASPFWHADPVMRLCVRLLRLRGQEVLCLFFHSTEIWPGGSPHVPDRAAADRVLGRIRSFLAWLRKSVPAEGTTLTRIYEEAQQEDLKFPERKDLDPAPGDW